MNMKTVERYGHAAEASDEVLNPSGSPVHIGTVCEISHEFVGAHIHAGCSGGRRASGPDVSDSRGGRRPSASATATAPPRRRASMPPAPARSNGSLSLSLSLSNFYSANVLLVCSS